MCSWALKICPAKGSALELQKRPPLHGTYKPVTAKGREHQGTNRIFRNLRKVVTEAAG